MSRVCSITGRGKAFGNKVSHSNIKTKRAYLINLHNTTLLSDILKKKFKMKIAARTIRTIEFKGGFDSYLLNTASRKLTEKAQKIKKQIKKALLNTAS